MRHSPSLHSPRFKCVLAPYWSCLLPTSENTQSYHCISLWVWYVIRHWVKANNNTYELYDAMFSHTHNEKAWDRPWFKHIKSFSAMEFQVALVLGEEEAVFITKENVTCWAAIDNFVRGKTLSVEELLYSIPIYFTPLRYSRTHLTWSRYLDV